MTTVFELIASASQKRNDGILFTLSGDLNQMAKQDTFLREQGFRMGRVDAYPGLFTKEDYISELKAIWEWHVAGWWNYRTEYNEHEICTEEEFKIRLGDEK